MKKNILLLGLVLIFTGCSCDYNLDMSGDKINEELNLNIPASLSSSKKDEIDKLFETNLDVYTDYENGSGEVYNINRSFVDNGYIYKLKYDHDFDKFGNSKVISDCFDDFQFKNTDEFIAIKASGRFACMYDNNKININITTDKYVSSNNASKVVNNTYSWEINNSNKDNVNIEYMMYKNYPSKNEVVSKNGSLFKNIFYTILLFIIFIGSAFGINIVLKKIDRI